MSNNVKITIGGKEVITGRLIGFVDDEECKAIINSEDAPKKINTSESTTTDKHTGKMTDNRFVLVTKEMSKDKAPAIFISPKVSTVYWKGENLELHCKDGKSYLFEEAESKDEGDDKDKNDAEDDVENTKDDDGDGNKAAENAKEGATKTE
jgi:hypothetical protein